MWIICAIVSAIFAALVTILAKIGLKNVDSTLATTLRATVMALLLIAVSLAFNKFHGLKNDGLARKEIIIIVLSGIAGAISWIFYFLALKNGNPTAVAALDKLSLAFVFILALIFLGEKFTVKSLLGVVLMVIGAFLVTIKK